jgi:hypothetical protein
LSVCGDGDDGMRREWSIGSGSGEGGRGVDDEITFMSNTRHYTSVQDEACLEFNVPIDKKSVQKFSQIRYYDCELSVVSLQP